MGFIYAFLSAFFMSTKDAVSKKALKNIDEYVVAWASRFFALFFLIPLLFFTKIPEIKTPFWWALIIGGTLNMLAVLFFMKAIKSADLSLVMPMLAFIPLFILIISPFLVGEFPGVFGLIGIILIVLGSYLLNLSKRTEGYFAPFRALLKERGTKFMLLTAFLWSISANFDKIGVLNSSPVFWSVAVNLFNSILLFLLVLFYSKRKKEQIFGNLPILLIIGLAVAFAFTFLMFSLKYILVSYALSIERLNILFAIIFGWFFFKEKQIKERLLGVIIMLIGILLITLF